MAMAVIWTGMVAASILCGLATGNGPAVAGGGDGLYFNRAIALRWGMAVGVGGSLVFEVGIGQSQDVERILTMNGFEQVQSTQDTQGIWRVVEGISNR